MSGCPLVLYLELPCKDSRMLHGEYILYLLRVHYAPVGECQFPVLECPPVGCPYEVLDTLCIFKMPVLVALKPVYTLCHGRVWREIADINKTVFAFQEETEDE